MRKFAGVPGEGRIERQWGGRKRRILVLSKATSLVHGSKSEPTGIIATPAQMRDILYSV